MSTARRVASVYQPRSRRAAMADTLAEARATIATALRGATLRITGGLILVAMLALLVALASYSTMDSSLNNATGRAAENWLGALGATAADLMFLGFGFATLVFIVPPALWGLRAMMGGGIRKASWRAIAWPLGVIFTAAGLGALPAPHFLPAGTGGLIGITVSGLAAHWGATDGMAWLGIVLPLLLLVPGLMLSFFATGLRFRPVARGIANVPAFFLWLASMARMPAFSFRSARDEEVDEEEYEYDDDDDDDEDEEDDEFALRVKPERVASGAIAREAARVAGRVKRDAARRNTARDKAAHQPALNLAAGEYQLPALGLLSEPIHNPEAANLSDEALEENARMLESVLVDFGVRGRIVAVRPGPVVTLYEFEPAAGVKSSRVISLADDVARSMSAVAARIAVIPGRNVMGIELPNQHRETVYLREMLSSPEYEKARAPLILALGKTIGGDPVMADLAKMPHLLIAGTTGSGKSVAVNTMILSLLYRMPPDICRMIMIDPKMLELSVYEGIPHLLAPVVTDPRKAVVALKWAVREMEERYRKMSKLGVRGVEAFNDRVRKAKRQGRSLKAHSADRL